MSHYPDHATDYEARYYWKDDVLGHLAEHEVAGGNAYPDENKLTEADADVTVDNADDLQSYCESSTHYTVWIDGPIDMGSRTEITTQNVTIAGDRGQGGSAGPLIYTNSSWEGKPYVFYCQDDVRITGIRARGPTHDYWDNDEYPGYLPYVDGRYDYMSKFATLRSNSVEVDNCELYGWGTQAMGVGTASNYVEPEIHHNYIHDNMLTSYGYAFTVYRGKPHVHHNFFDAHRHAVNGFGYHDSGYVVEDNVFGPSASSHQIDMHVLDGNLPDDDLSSDPDDENYKYRGGGDCVIRRNTFLFTNVIHGPEMPSHPTGFDRGRWHWVYSNRGIPQPGRSVEISENRIMHHGPQSGNPGEGGSVRDFTADAFVQDTHGHSTNDQGFVRVNHYDNQYDSVHTAYDPNYGAPVNVEGTPSGPSPSRGLDGYQYPRSRLKELHDVIQE